MSISVIRLKPQQYIHVLDNNINITQMMSGPLTYTIPQHQSLVFNEPKPFVSIPQGSYAIIENPAIREKDGNYKKDKHGQIETRLGEREVRLFQDPFPLYPGEVLIEQKALQVLTPHQALVLRAIKNFKATVQGVSVDRVAGDEFLFRGPATYYPSADEEVVERRDATIVKTHESLRLRAKNKHTDQSGVLRQVGEEYLWTKEGGYMLSVDEVLISVEKASILTPFKAIHVECLKAFVDDRAWAKGTDRKPGNQYLVTNKQVSSFTCLPTEKLLREVQLVVVTRNQYAIVLDPVENGVQKLGKRKIVSACEFFLQPGERLDGSVRPVYVLGDDEALLLSAIEDFDDNGTKRGAGELWLLQGPCDYIPPASANVIKDKKGQEKRKRIVLPEGEGVYVRNTQAGEVRLATGSFMLAATEELWEKTLDPIVEEKLARQGASHATYMEKDKPIPPRDKTVAVRFAVPHNAVTQVFDFKKSKQRTIFGPGSVLLGPDENFTVKSLSGSDWDPARPNICLPKQTGKIKSLYIFLGPSNMADVLDVETADHARLRLQLCYDWYFDVEPGNVEQANECIAVPDFVSDCCSCIASRVRASIAAMPFDIFHKHSSKMLTTAVFGTDKATGKPKTELRFPYRLVVTSVDIQEIELLDEKTRVALQESVKKAIEITTQAQEQGARQEASVREQKAKGMLERQQIEDKSTAEVERKNLLEYETASSSIESTGQAKAEAKARSEALEIEGGAAVSCARIKAETAQVMDKQQLDMKVQKNTIELDHQMRKNQLDVDYSKQISEIEAKKFQDTMTAVGQDTVQQLAKAGPELQVKLLKAMGLEGFLVTDGTNPINLFNTAKGLAQSSGSA